MLLQRFNGGLNTRLAPELIAPNEAVVCKNVSFSAGQLKSAKGLGATPVTPIVDGYYFEGNSEWMPNALTRDYLEYQGKLYWSDGGIAKKYDGTTISNLGIIKPATAPTTVLNGGGVLTGTLQYVYTYYNIADGTESEPSPISPELVATSNQVNLDLVASTDPQVTHIEVYRIGGGFVGFTKVAEVANVSATYTDNTANSSLAAILLNSATNGAPLTGLQFLTYSAGVFFGAIGSKLYFTVNTGNPNYWPEINTLDFRLPITGIAVSPSGLIIFSRYQAWLVTGTSVATFIRYPLSSDQGCISHKTIAELGATVMFLSTDGICAATGSKVTVLSKFKLGKRLFNPINAVVYDEKYTCQLVDGSLITFDLRYEPAIATYDFQTQWLAVANDIFYAATANGLVPLFDSGLVEYQYTTGDLTEGSLSGIKNYKSIYFYAEGEHTIKVYINGILRFTKDIIGESKPLELKLPQDYQVGSSMRLELSGIGTIKEIEFKAMGRANGK